MNVVIIEEKGSHLLVGRDEQFAALERRDDRLYNCRSRDRGWVAANRLSEIDRIVDAWTDELSARAAFLEIVARGTDLAQTMR